MGEGMLGNSEEESFRIWGGIGKDVTKEYSPIQAVLSFRQGDKQ